MLYLIASLLVQPDRPIIAMVADGRSQAEYTESKMVRCRDLPISITYTSGWGDVDVRIDRGTIGGREIPKAVVQNFNQRVFGRRLDRLAFRDCYFAQPDGFNGVQVIASGRPDNPYAHEPMAIVLKDR